MNNDSLLYKYKPETINDLLLPEYLINKLNNIVKNIHNMPNLILIGSSGVGKTSTINCYLRDIFGKDYKNYILELNSLTNRNLDSISTNISYFCKKKIDKKLKVILIDDADIIIKKTQNIISSFMDEYNNICRFIFICNETNKIIEAIQSRSIILKFTSVDSNKIIVYLEKICNQEKIEYDIEGIKAIEFIAQGNLMQSINILKVIHLSSNKITVDNVNNLCYLPHKQIIYQIILDCVNGKLIKIINNLKLLKNLGYSSNDTALILLNLLKTISIDEQIRINFINILSKTYITISNGNDSFLQLYGCIARMIQYIME